MSDFILTLVARDLMTNSHTKFHVPMLNSRYIYISIRGSTQLLSTEDAAGVYVLEIPVLF